MSKAFAEEMEKDLLARRADIIERMMENDDEFFEIAQGSGIQDSIDSASNDIAIKRMEVLNRFEANRLKAITNAIKRIHNGRYGVCASCGKKIPEERLRALPWATLCMDCKNKQEHPHRR